MREIDLTIVIVSVCATDNGPEIQAVLKELTGQGTVPNVFVNGEHIGGCDDTLQAFSNGSLSRKVVEGQMRRDPIDPAHKYDYDLVVLGGGSGGLACAKVGGGNEDCKCPDCRVCVCVSMWLTEDTDQGDAMQIWTCTTCSDHLLIGKFESSAGNRGNSIIIITSLTCSCRVRHLEWQKE